MDGPVCLHIVCQNNRGWQSVHAFRDGWSSVKPVQVSVPHIELFQKA